MSFLTAEWRKLAMINYRVNPKILDAYLPAGTELDLWQGHCYVSLVGFCFVDTRLLGLAIPFHRHFEEVNLRFYVRRHVDNAWRRGVVFIKEIVPKPALTFVANTVYKEHYETLPMKYGWNIGKELLEISYHWKKSGIWSNFSVTAQNNVQPIPESSETEFITEHYWGYSKVNSHSSIEYEVTHPKWLHYPVQNCEINVDFEHTYGKSFGFLNQQVPQSALLAEGSSITVEKRRRFS